MTRQYNRTAGKSSDEMDGPKAPDVIIPASGDFTYDDIDPIEVVVDVMADKKDWADKMRFMSEMVRIRLNESTNANDEPRVPVCVNGVRSHPVWGNHLPRGIEIDVRRYVAEALLRAKPISVKTAKTIDHDGNDTSKIIRTVGTMYPFQLCDPKPRDMDWMRKIQAEA